jgi:hypothetical protein
LRTTRAVFRALEIKRLSQLGHEVGYHYEVFSKAKGSAEQAIAFFEQELKQFRQFVPVDTVSMHGSPLRPWNNFDLWQTYDFEDYGILGDAVLSIKTQDLYYFTDTGRCWDASRCNIRDHMASRKPPRKIHTTDDLIHFLEKRPDCPVYVNAHPNRWASNWLTWSVGAVSDWVINWVKWIVSLTRRQRG